MVARFPPARGSRLDWSAMPERIRSEIGRQLGAPVIEATTQPEGFSPAVAARVRTAAGRRAFVKGVPPDRNPETPTIYRREIRVVTALPEGLPVPRLLWWLDEGDDGWVVLMFEEIAGVHPALPWSRDELSRVRDLLVQLSATAAPEWFATQTAGDWIASRWCSWAALAAEPPAGLDDWSRRHAGRLAEIERDIRDAVDGDALVHLDVRWDNLLLDVNRSWLVDWPWARRGAWWLDAVLFAPTVEMQGGPPAEEVLAAHTAHATVDHDAVLVAAAAFTGMLLERSLAPPPPGLPTIRPFQAASAAAGRSWLRRLTGWR